VSNPTLFVGSSTEGLAFARAVRQQLNTDAEVTLWNEGLFSLGQTTIATLIGSLSRFDFAVLVLTGDDLVQSRNDEKLGPRDNVIFEMGLFMGRLGPSRTIALVQSKAQIKIPSDLAGVTLAQYAWPRDDRSELAAVGAACDEIRRIIKDLGISETRTAKISELVSRQKDQEGQLRSQQEQIRMLRFAVRGIVTQYEWDKLVGLNSEQPFTCHFSHDLIAELKHLRAMGLVSNHHGIGLRDLRQLDGSGESFDLKRFFRITSYGQEYLTLREQAVVTEDE
jgi:hypothetical protein